MKLLVCCLMAAIFIMSGSAQAEEARYLQVIGETDWQSDQTYKLTVRDWALEAAASSTEELQDTLNDRAEAAGRPRNITVDTGINDLVRVRIGRAEGRNWWGLLYPEEAGLDGDVIYYSAIVDWLLAFFGL